MRLKRAKGPSLTLRLLVSLTIAQALATVVGGAALVYWVADRSTGYVNKSIANELEASLALGPDGPIVTDQARIDAVAAEHARLWWIARDPAGRQLSFGQPPEVLAGVVQGLPAFVPAELIGPMSHPELSMRVDALTITGGKLLLLTGGGKPGTLQRTAGLLALFFTSWFALPLIALSSAAIAWAIWRATRGLQHVVRQAAALELSERTAHLPEDAVPREIRPLIRAFNGALDRIKAEHQDRDRFLRDAAHEIRIPIAVLMARVEELPAHPVKATLLTDLSRLTTLAEQLLDLQRLRGLSEAMGTVDLCELAREVVSEMAPLALGRGNDLVVEAPDRAVEVTGQATALGRVLANLVQNALVHGGSPGAVIVTVRRDGSHGVLEVSDEGDGIAAPARREIFRPFVRGDSSGSGHGLGLHLVDEIVKLHGGHVTVDRSEA
ncbi:HAMP domain-containing sensor histidine kinase, partial [Mitsuaria sp. GD03876]|uniref:sensor histidine kinase n=1 Tax=Mitsuaria sp. GD03876 TaxID=2975399 RepID=UPI00244B2C7F